jgi:phage-related minor tail protein
MPSANGNVFSGGIHSGMSNVIPFANGGVVNSAKYFPMSGGTGLMGEAGPEAIMPLQRDSSGKLGVSANGGGGGTQVNIFNQSGGQVEAKERKDSSGMKVIDIMIKAAVAKGMANGDFDKTMSSVYGLRRQGVR